MKHLLKLLDLTGEEIVEILDLADQLKYERKNGIAHPHLAGKTLGMIFQTGCGLASRSTQTMSQNPMMTTVLSTCWRNL